MSPQPQHGTPDGDATLAIRALARRTGADVQELQTLYVLEALLARISVSPHRDDFVLKGGVLLAAFGLRRPTKDIDLQASQLSNDEEGVVARIRKIADIDLPDGVMFDSSTVATSAIRDGAEYAGVRVNLIGNLGRARVSIGVDVKTVTASQRGQANTRWRDYAEILAISRRHRIESNELLEALEAVANDRQTKLTTLRYSCCDQLPSGKLHGNCTFIP